MLAKCYGCVLCHHVFDQWLKHDVKRPTRNGPNGANFLIWLGKWGDSLIWLCSKCVLIILSQLKPTICMQYSLNICNDIYKKTSLDIQLRSHSSAVILKIKIKTFPGFEELGRLGCWNLDYIWFSFFMWLFDVKYAQGQQM